MKLKRAENGEELKMNLEPRHKEGEGVRGSRGTARSLSAQMTSERKELKNVLSGSKN
jgi:hypothetical protein